MFYVCVENNEVISICDYEPNVPSSVSVFTITDDEHRMIASLTHKIDATTKKVVPTEVPDSQTSSTKNLAFLASTDWQVLRHIRQKALGISTSLSEEEYITLEEQRQAASTKIQKATR